MLSEFNFKKQGSGNEKLYQPFYRHCLKNNACSFLSIRCFVFFAGEYEKRLSFKNKGFSFEITS
jgi:hypothetical protein